MQGMLRFPINPFLYILPLTGHGGISNIIDDMQLLSTEAEGVNEAIPEDARRALVRPARAHQPPAVVAAAVHALPTSQLRWRHLARQRGLGRAAAGQQRSVQQGTPELPR